MQTKTFPVEKVARTKIHEVDLDNPVFGKFFTDHMFVADYRDGRWQDARIVPFQRLSLHPATSALHYGQSIFEGLKAFYYRPAGRPALFRVEDNWRRMNRSAQRMCMPELPRALFVDAIYEWLSLDADWVPKGEGTSLYIRPFMFATDEYVGIRPSETYKYIIFGSPAGPYYPAPIPIRFEFKYSRACEGGTGAAKSAGNYAGSLYPAKLAMEEGYRQLIWTDACHHQIIEESGTMNIFFVLDGRVVTPSTRRGTILEGITRDSVIRLLQLRNIPVEERDITVDEVVEGLESGRLTEVFGTGTAASVAFISAIGYKDRHYTLPELSEDQSIARRMKTLLEGIKYGTEPDPFGWVRVVQ